MWWKVAVWFVYHTWDNIIRQSKAWHKWTLANPASPESGIRITRQLNKNKFLWHFCKTTLHRQASGWLLATPVSEGPHLSDEAVMYPMTFPMMFVCHCCLSALIALQSKYWNKLDVHPYQRLKPASFQTFNLWKLQLAPAISLLTQYNTSATIRVGDRIYVSLMYVLPFF